MFSVHINKTHFIFQFPPSRSRSVFLLVLFYHVCDFLCRILLVLPESLYSWVFSLWVMLPLSSAPAASTVTCSQVFLPQMFHLVSSLCFVLHIMISSPCDSECLSIFVEGVLQFCNKFCCHEIFLILSLDPFLFDF